MKKYEGDKTALCAYFHFTLGIQSLTQKHAHPNKTNFLPISNYLYLTLNPQVNFYSKAKLRIIIGNARFSILTVAMATFACLKTVLDQY